MPTKSSLKLWPSSSDVSEETEDNGIFHVVATFSAPVSSHSEGMCLKVNWEAQTAFMGKYVGRSSLGSWTRWSRESSQDAIARCQSEHGAIPLREMRQQAETRRDPCMTLRILTPDDSHFAAATCLYSSFLWLMKSGEYNAPLTEKHQHRYSPAFLAQLGRVQALYRGYRFRKYVLHNPHTWIGHEYLMRKFSAELADVTPTHPASSPGVPENASARPASCTPGGKSRPGRGKPA